MIETLLCCSLKYFRDIWLLTFFVWRVLRWAFWHWEIVIDRASRSTVHEWKRWIWVWARNGGIYLECGVLRRLLAIVGYLARVLVYLSVLGRSITLSFWLYSETWAAWCHRLNS